MSGRYKAVKIDKDQQAFQVWRYIHLNPMQENLCGHPAEYSWSSYKFFMGEPDEIRIDSELIETFFKTQMAIEEFHTDKEDYERNLPSIKDLMIEK
jgi:putative transposase